MTSSSPGNSPPSSSSGGRPKIRFVGVWDTVASVIVPRPDRQYWPSLEELAFTLHNPSVKTFRQAMSIDELRAKAKQAAAELGRMLLGPAERELGLVAEVEAPDGETVVLVARHAVVASTGTLALAPVLAAAGALVGEGGVGETVADHNVAGGQCRHVHRLHAAPLM